MKTEFIHRTVLLQPALDVLLINKSGTYVDCTFGRGGHSMGILDYLDSDGRLVAMDKDEEAYASGCVLAEKDSRLRMFHADFSQLADICQQAGIFGNVDGVLFDLGVSSPQLDDPLRGFSFSQDGPLDMRMDRTTAQTAAKWLASATRSEIGGVLKEFGEERFANRMATAIVKARAERPICTTGQLAEIVAGANPAWEKDKHPATRAFQAIRIYINNELGALKTGLSQALEALHAGGRMVVISFHSLEDKIVKNFMSLQTKGDNFPRHVPVTQDQLNPRLKIVGKPVRPPQGEIAVNPRARSAIMRVAEKLS